jgi:hypothetical protein
MKSQAWPKSSTLPTIAKPPPVSGRLVKPVPAKAGIGTISLDTYGQKVN